MIVSCQSLAMKPCLCYLQLLSSALIASVIASVIVSVMGQNCPKIGKAEL
jgi:hypothetical protein